MRVHAIAIMATGLTGLVIACTPLKPTTTLTVDGRDYAATFRENRDPVTDDLIEIRYTIAELGVECGSRAECAPLIREAEAKRAADALQPLAEEVAAGPTDETAGADTTLVEVSPLEDATQSQE